MCICGFRVLIIAMRYVQCDDILELIEIVRSKQIFRNLEYIYLSYSCSIALKLCTLYRVEQMLGH